MTNSVVFNEAGGNSMGLFFDKSHANSTTYVFAGSVVSAVSGNCITPLNYNAAYSTGDGLDFYATSIPIAGWTSTFNPVLSMPLVNIGNNVEQYSVGGWTGNYNYRSYTTNTPRVNTINNLGTVRGGTSSQSWRFTASQRVKVTATAWFNYTTARWVGLMAGSSTSNVADSTIAVSSTSIDSVRVVSTLVETSNDVESVAASFIMEPGDIFEPSGDANTVAGPLDGGLTMTVEKLFDNTNMAHIIKPAVCKLTEVQAYNAEGGAATSTNNWETRTLNTIEGESWFLTLASNQFTLEPGAYKVQWEAPYYNTGYTQTVLYDVTNSAFKAIGNGNYINPSGGVGILVAGYSQFTISSSTVFSIKGRVSDTKSSNGMGNQSGFSDSKSIFTMVMVEKLK